MTPPDAHLYEMTGSAVTVAEEPDVGSDARVFNIGFELRADFNDGHGGGETPQVLGGEIVPVILGRCAHGWGETRISDPDYVVGPCRSPVELIVGECLGDILAVRS